MCVSLVSSCRKFLNKIDSVVVESFVGNKQASFQGGKAAKHPRQQSRVAIKLCCCCCESLAANKGLAADEED